MTKVIDIVRDALGYLRVIDAADAVDENDAADAILALNRMMRVLEADGLTLGWSDVARVDDVVTTPPEADEAIGAHLALRLGPKYGKAPEQAVINMATEGAAMLRAQVASHSYERMTTPDLPIGEAQPFGYRGWRNGFHG